MSMASVAAASSKIQSTRIVFVLLSGRPFGDREREAAPLRLSLA